MCKCADALRAPLSCCFFSLTLSPSPSRSSWLYGGAICLALRHSHAYRARRTYFCCAGCWCWSPQNEIKNIPQTIPWELWTYGLWLWRCCVIFLWQFALSGGQRFWALLYSSSIADSHFWVGLWYARLYLIYLVIELRKQTCRSRNVHSHHPVRPSVSCSITVRISPRLKASSSGDSAMFSYTALA